MANQSIVRTVAHRAKYRMQQHARRLGHRPLRTRQGLGQGFRPWAGAGRSCLHRHDLPAEPCLRQTFRGCLGGAQCQVRLHPSRSRDPWAVQGDFQPRRHRSHPAGAASPAGRGDAALPIPRRDWPRWQRVPEAIIAAFAAFDVRLVFPFGGLPIGRLLQATKRALDAIDPGFASEDRA